MFNPVKVASAVALVALTLTGCAANEGGETESPAASLTGTLNGAGASSAGSAQEAWIAEFQMANDGVTVNYDPSGSGAGRESFFAGAVQFAGTDSSLSDDELALTSPVCAAEGGFFEVPVYVSPIAVIFNVDGVDALNLAPATIAGIFKGDITNWNDAAIAADNPDVTFPDLAITAVHRSDDSGTTKNFTDYLSKNAGDIWDGEVGDAFPYSTGEGASGTSGVVDAVTNGTGTIGYADASKAGDLGTANIKVGDTWVGHTPEGAAAVVALSPRIEGRSATDMAVSIDRTLTDSTAYPLVLVSYLIGCNDYADDAIGVLVNAYASYLTSVDGQATAAANAGSAPVSGAVQEEAAAITAAIK
ncbi:MAG: phosphate transporter substrate-binding protein PstS [Actinomycetota bacterium]|jgi:phosphate transport system substrate-binding protein